MTSKQERIEQAVAWGRSDEWITDRLRCTVADVREAERRIDAAHHGFSARDDDEDEVRGHRGEADPVMVEGILDGRIRVRPGSPSPELIEAVRVLAGRGLTDVQIGQRIGRKRDAVTMLRRRNQIPAGSPVPTGATWRKYRYPNRQRAGVA